jgi:hypothetical protein
MINKSRGFFLVMIMIYSQESHSTSWVSVTELFTSLQQDLSAFSVEVKQSAVAANQQSLATLNSYKVLSTARGATQMSNKVVDAYTSFDPSTGQASSNSCLAHMQNSYTLQAHELSDQNQYQLMQNYVSHRYGNQSQADAERLSIHKDTYCSASEATFGVCQLNANGMQAWDSNYAGAFVQDTVSPEAELAGYAYVANMTDQRITTSQECRSVACQSAILSQMQSSAINSMAANSLIGQLTDRRIPEIKAGN